MFSRVLFISATLLGSITLGVSAQDYDSDPTYGSARLSGGFLPDPHTITVQAGGSIDASESIGGSCVGNISQAPDYRINFTPGSQPLIISVDSAYDTTLVINNPDGEWFCDDDSGNSRSHNPSIRFNNPESGQYDIWIGTYNSDLTPNAVLQISELTSR
ncbi:peptidase S1 [Cyanobacterium sp. IPPAS B-1200]|uniref:peptidase S1 n=1 Tax=Cyanobacterium sp. IPPAS B-1200 TaxID=1562720 RepID=UPI0008527E62|nr:peptidase S1 [Cyanobacterium sp. IPPAS B-1200]OEJ77308.1 peptidase S1 [Cyanobacterium sp. IPPAS B-1200]